MTTIGNSTIRLEKTGKGCLGSYFECGCVPRKLISQKVEILHMQFTRIGAEANSGRVSFVRGIAEAFLIKLFLKVFEEPEAVFSPEKSSF